MNDFIYYDESREMTDEDWAKLKLLIKHSTHVVVWTSACGPNWVYYAIADQKRP